MRLNETINNITTLLASAFFIWMSVMLWGKSYFWSIVLFIIALIILILGDDK